MTDFDDILADLELKLTETQMGTPQPAAPKVSKPATNPVLGRTTSTSNGVPSLNTKAAASRPAEPPLPSPGISLDSFSELDALVESLNKPSTPKMTTTPSQSNLTKPAAATPPKQSNPNPVRQPSSAGLPKAPTKTPSTNNLPTTAPPKVAATAPPKMAAAPPKVAPVPTHTPAPMHTPAPTPTPTPAPSFNTQASSGRLTDSDPVQKLAQVVATNLGRDAASVQQWMDIFRRNEIETVGDLTALRPDDWPRLGLPLRIERAMRDALSDTGGSAAPSNPVVPPLANPGAPKLPLNNVNRPQPVSNQPLRSPRGSQSGVACRNCQQPIMGEHLIALGHHYHKEHFTCSTCSKLLQSNQFFADGDAIKCANCIKNKYICCRCGQGMTGTFLRYSDGRYVHQTCLGAGKCGKCGHEVTGPQLEALGQIWHATCFTCTRCNINLSAEFLSVENKPYCKSCVGALTKSRVNDPMDSFGYEEPPQPQAQRQPMTKQPSNTSLNGGYSGYGGSMSRSNSENFLNDTPRSNSSRLEDTFSDGESDMERVVCSRCLGTITDAEYIALSDKQLHKDCFNCDNCEAKLDADNFYEQDGQLLCEICVNVLSM